MQGKPYAGNPHVRFDEGAGAPRPSGRPALLYTTRKAGKLIARPLATALVLLFAVCEAVAATVLYVKPGGTGAGTSWSDAADLEAAVAAASAAGGEYDLYLAQGVYHPSATVKIADGISGISLYGSFPGLSDDETLESRSVERTPSIISGDRAGSAYWQKADGTTVMDGSGNPMRVFESSVFNEPNPTKEDFYWRPVATNPVKTLVDAQAARADEGAGMQLVFDGVTFALGAVVVGRSESKFRDCRLLACPNGADKPVVTCWTNIVLTGTEFVGNFAQPVTVTDDRKMSANTCKWVISNCVFKANVGGSYQRGPAISQRNADLDVFDTAFLKNVTYWQGDSHGSLVIGSDYSKIRLIGCEFSENVFSNNPSIVKFPYAAHGIASNCLFRANRVIGDVGTKTAADYGTIVFSSGGATLYNTTFLSNEVDFARTEIKAGATNGYACVVYGNRSVGFVNCHLEGNRTRYTGPDGQEEFNARSCTVYQGGGHRYPFVGTSFFENDFLDGEVFVNRQSTEFGLYFVNSIFWGTSAGYAPIGWNNTTKNYLDFYNCIIKNAPMAGGTGSTGVVHQYISCTGDDPQFGELTERDGRFYRPIGRGGGARRKGAPFGVSTDGKLSFQKTNGNWYQCAQPWIAATFASYLGDMFGSVSAKDPTKPDLGPVQNSILTGVILIVE